jgi:hypothetical protein
LIKIRNSNLVLGKWGLTLIPSLQINRKNWTHQLLIYDGDVTKSVDKNYYKKNKKALLDAVKVADELVKRE